MLHLTILPVIYKLDRKDGSCDVVTMDWLLNPKFLPPSRRNRRRRDDSDSDMDSDEEDHRVVESVPQNNTTAAEPHTSEVDYGDDDNMMYAPIRRTLPLPLGNVSSSKSNSRGRRSNSKENTTGAAFLATLRSFAHKEANEPGSGCRLFIQACVFSGCDYVPNRLSKVGPITAFKMMKDASHRKHDERFNRVMKSLPRGSILQHESSEDKNEDDDNDEDDDGFFASFGSYNDLKEKYLELLTKSEAIFYYHLVKEQASDSITPLVPHKQPDSSDTAGNLSPSIVNFNSDLSFIGSVEEALKNKPTAAPPCSRNQVVLNSQQNNTGWINTKRPAGTVKNTYKKQPVSQSKVDSENQGPHKSTLQYAFSRHNDGLKSRAEATGQSSLLGKLNYTTKQRTGLPTSSAATARQSANPFSSFAFNCKPEDNNNAIESSNITSKALEQATTKKSSPVRSPFFSPIGRSNFDYAEEPSARKDLKSPLKNDEIETDDVVEVHREAGHNNGLVETSADSQVPSSPPVKPVNDENAFDYEIIVESPPIKSMDRESRYSKYFGGSPRRVSTSPSFKPNALDEGSSPDYAIDLSDDPESPKKPLEEALSWSQTSNLSKSSVNKRPFKSPYPSNHQSSQAVARKKPRQASSGALLAGFGIQRDPTTGAPLSARQRLAARNAGNKKLKAKKLTIQNYLKRT